MALYVGHRKYDTYVGSHKVMFALKSEEPLPYDAEVEYIETTGTQYLDTGAEIIANSSVIELDVAALSFVQYGNVLGAYPGGRGYYCLPFGCSTNTQMSTMRAIYGNDSFSGGVISFQYQKGKRVLIRYEAGGKLLVDGSEVGTFTSTFTPPVGGVKLFVGRTSSEVPAKFYGLKVVTNDALVRDFIPVRVGTTGYLYDKVSKQLFGNQGSGSFVVGPDKN